MDSWQAAQSWLLFTGVAGGLGLYYWSQNKAAQPAATANRRRSIQETRPEPKRRTKPERPVAERKVDEKTAVKPATTNGSESTKKRKAGNTEQTPPQAVPAVAEQEDDQTDEVDMSTKQFAQQWAKAKQGMTLSASKHNEQRLRTVKQSSAATAKATLPESSQAGAEADDDTSPSASPAMHAGDVSDMLEPTSKGPTSLRLTTPAKPQKERVARQPKEEMVETKKQRQNRMKKDQQRLEREAEEKDRKALEERQRRSAREARGEPAKNGIPVSKPPASNAWTAPKATLPVSNTSGPATNGATSAVLLDTFDGESSASSNGGLEVSSAATSTTEPDAGHRDRDALSEEEQMSAAMKQSEDDSGWTTVAVPKKQKKQAVDGEATVKSTPAEPAPAPKAAPLASKPAINGKPNGFQALNDHYEQRADVDPNDASNWDA